MADIIDFPNINDVAIEVERNEEFVTAANRLSEYIALLPLNHEQNDELVKLMIEQVQVAERGAFLQGFKIGCDLMNEKK